MDIKILNSLKILFHILILKNEKCLMNENIIKTIFAIFLLIKKLNFYALV